MTLFRAELERMNDLAEHLPDTLSIDAPPRCDRCEASFSTTSPLGSVCEHEPKCPLDGWTLIPGNPPWCSGCEAIDWSAHLPSSAA